MRFMFHSYFSVCIVKLFRLYHTEMSLLFVTLVVLVVQCHCDISPSDYVYWKKADIEAWNQYFPSRSLQEEALTQSAALYATSQVASGLSESLRRLVKYQSLELQTAELMMQGTYAQGCIQGIAADIESAIQSAVSEYDDCTADVSSILQRQQANLTKTLNNYLTVYANTLNGINNCALVYPNKDSQARLKNCVDSWNNNYFSAAGRVMTGVLASPSMKVFTNTVVQCAETAAQQVVSRGWQFLDNLVKCSTLSENVDWQAYQAQVTAGFSSYITSFDLATQVSRAQYDNSVAVAKLEQEMLDYYSLQKSALEQYVIESRGQGFYTSQLYSILAKYYSAVSQAQYDNPADAACATLAYSTLANAVQAGSLEVLKCDQRIVNDTVSLLAKVNSDFQWINNFLPTVGNYAILNCFSQGYIFMEQTISKCYSLEWAHFAVDSLSIHSDITQDVATLLNYRDHFFGNSSLPCSDSVLPNTFRQAAQALYDLERCLYIDSGAKYEVTTTSPIGASRH